MVARPHPGPLPLERGKRRPRLWLITVELFGRCVLRGGLKKCTANIRRKNPSPSSNAACSPLSPAASAWEPSPGLGAGTAATLELAVPVRSPAPMHRAAEDTEPLFSLVLPADLDTQDLEVVVQVRQRDRVLLEAQLCRPAPSPGATDQLTIDLKRP